MGPQITTLALVFMSTLAVVLAAQYFATRTQRSMDRRMRAVVEGISESLSVTGVGGTRVYLPVVTARLKGSFYFHRIEKKLVAAAVPLRPAEFMVICCLVGAAGFLTAAVWSHRGMTALLWGGAGFFAPHMVLNLLADRRRQILETQLADTLVMVTSALQAGFSFLQGIQMAAEQMPQPIGMELQRMVRLVQLGMPLEEALRQFGDRVQSYDYDLMVAATTLQLSTGGNLIRLYKTITETIQERLRIRGEIQATTAEGRLSALVLLGLPIFVMCALLVIKPDYAHSMLFTPLGQTMLKTAVGLQLLGVIVIRRILNLNL